MYLSYEYYTKSSFICYSILKIQTIYIYYITIFSFKNKNNNFLILFTFQ